MVRIMNGGDLLAMTLAREGVECFIGIVGGQILPLFDAIGREPGLRLVVPRNEAAGAMMADGYTRGCGEVAAVISTVGAGAIYSVAGTANAWGDHVPIFSVSPQVQSWKMYPAQESLQGCYQADMLAGATRWNCIAYNWKRIPRMAQRALREALSGERGPVHMDVPVDVLYEFHLVTEGRLKKLMPAPSSSRFSGSFLPDAVSLREALRLVEAAERPVVAAGLGVLREEAWDGICELAGALPAPVLLTPGALSAMAGDDPGYCGVAGHPAMGNITEALGQADLLLMIGTTLGEQEELLDMASGAGTSVIQTSPEPELLGSLGPVESALAGDSASIAGALAGGIGEANPARRAWLETCRASFEAALQSLAGDAGERGSGAAVRVLGEALDPEDLMVIDGRESYYWGSALCPAGRCNSRFHSPGLSGVGYGLPMAMGVKLARPGERVLALCDTEALLHHVQELDTARREGIEVIVCVVGEPFGWVEVAEGFGIPGREVKGPAELGSAMETAGRGGTAFLVDMTGFGT